MSTPAEPETNRQGSSVAHRLVSLSPLFAGLLAVWNASIQFRLNDAEAKLRERSQQLEAQRDRIARLTFVHDRLIPDILGDDARRRDLTVRLVRLTIPEDADSLFSGWQASSDTSIRAAGRAGARAADDERSAILISRLTSSVATERLAAFDTLKSRYTGDTPAITYALDVLDPSRLSQLSADGRVNVLLFLSQTRPEAWSPAQITRADANLRAVEESVRGTGGTLTLQRLAEVRTILGKARTGG